MNFRASNKRENSMTYRKRVYIEEIPRVSIGKDYYAIETLIANEGGIKMTIHEAKKKLVFFFRYYQEFPIPEDGVVVCSIPCNYGGLRYFYLCPFCRKRYRHLYITRGKKHPHLVCRKCCSLFYRTQSESAYDRLLVKFSKLLHRHKVTKKNIYEKEKPKGLHEKSFKRTQIKIQKAWNKIDQYLYLPE